MTLMILESGNILTLSCVYQKYYEWAFTRELSDFLCPAGSDSTEGRNLLRSQFDGKSNLFYVELPEDTVLSYAVDDKEKFPVQFGREVCHTKNCFAITWCFLFSMICWYFKLVGWFHEKGRFVVSELPLQVYLEFPIYDCHLHLRACLNEFFIPSLCILLM